LSPGKDISSDDGCGTVEDYQDQFSQNGYVKQLWDAADLHILQPRESQGSHGRFEPETWYFPFVSV
jgi:hypothetical protein